MARLAWPDPPAVVAEEARANLGTAYDILPGVLDGAVASRVWAGLDGYTPHRVATLGPSTRRPGLLHPIGFSGHGFALMPAVGEAIAEIALGAAAADPALAQARFAAMPVS